MKPTLTILHIDDDPDMRFLLQELLAEGEGERVGEFEVRLVEAPGLQEAVGRYGDLRLHAILLDNRLGGVYGVELLPLIRRVWDCPVWILTGLSTEMLSERSRRCGAAGVISKDELLRSATHLRSFLRQCGALPPSQVEESRHPVR